MRKLREKTRFIPIDKLSPQVDLAGYWRQDPHDGVRYHVPGHHLMLVEAGEIETKVDGALVRAGTGDMLAFRPAATNEYRLRGVTTFFQAHLTFAAAPYQRHTPWLDDAGQLPIIFSTGDSFDEMRSCFETICMTVSESSSAARLEMMSAVLRILAIVARQRAGTSPLRHPDPWERVRHRLETDYAGKLSGEDLARQMHITPDHFIRRFKRQFGLTPKSLHLRARLNESARILRATERSVKAIALGMGFSDAQAFAKLFKRHMGVRPSDLRLARPIIEASAPASPKHLYPMNRHLLPAGFTGDVMQKFRPRK